MLIIDKTNLDLTSPKAIAYKNWVTENSALYLKNPAASLGYQYNAFRAAEVFHLWGGDDNARAAVKMAVAYVESEHEVMKTFVPGPKGKEWEQKNLPLIMQNSMLDAHILIGNLSHTIAYCSGFMTVAERSELGDWGIQCCRAFIQTDPNVMLDGKPVWWSRWSINDPSNNYYHSFTDTVERFGLATGIKEFIDGGRKMLLAIAATFANNKGGGSPEGNGYGLSLGLVAETFGIHKDSTGESFPEVARYFSETLKFFCHATAPSFTEIVPTGDHARERHHWISDADKELVYRAYPLANAEGKGLASWWLKTVSLGEGQWGRPSLGRNELIAVTAQPAQPTELQYTAETVGVTFMRSSWAKNADYLVVCHGPIDQAHAHDDQGSIHLHSKGQWILTSQSTNSRTGILQEPEYQNVLIVEELVNGVWTKIRPDKKAKTETTVSAGAVTVKMNGYGVKCAWTRHITYVNKQQKYVDTVVPGQNIRARIGYNTPHLPAINGTGAILNKTPFTFSLLGGPSPQLTVYSHKELHADNGMYGGYRIELFAPGTVTYQTTIALDAEVVIPPTPTPPTPTPDTSEIDTLKAQIAARDNVIAAQKVTLAALNSDIVNYLDTIQAQKLEMDNCKLKSAALLTENEFLKASIEELIKSSVQQLVLSEVLINGLGNRIVVGVDLVKNAIFVRNG